MDLLVPNMSDLSETPSATGLQENDQTHWLCEKHKRKLELFCKNDEQLVCLVCQDSELHKHHKFIPAGEATIKKKVRVFGSEHYPSPIRQFHHLTSHSHIIMITYV